MSGNTVFVEAHLPEVGKMHPAHTRRTVRVIHSHAQWLQPYLTINTYYNHLQPPTTIHNHVQTSTIQQNKPVLLSGLVATLVHWDASWSLGISGCVCLCPQNHRISTPMFLQAHLAVESSSVGRNKYREDSRTRAHCCPPLSSVSLFTKSQQLGRAGFFFCMLMHRLTTCPWKGQALFCQKVEIKSVYIA